MGCMMDWVKILLRKFKNLVILILVIGFTILWLQVPDYKLNEPEVNHASKQSKRGT
jgi:hypothetical protein